MRPLPYPDHLTGPYWAAAREGVLSLPRCEDCGEAHFYPRPACPFCGGPVDPAGHLCPRANGFRRTTTVE